MNTAFERSGLQPKRISCVKGIKVARWRNSGGTAEFETYFVPVFWDGVYFFEREKFMIKVIFNGNEKQFEENMSVFDALKSLGGGMYKTACAAVINGENKDLRTVLCDGDSVQILTFEDEYGRWTFRHTASHILAQAVKRLYPSVKLAIGPAVDDGFYYDIDTDIKFTPEDLTKIESEMKNIVKEDIKLERSVMNRADALKLFADKGESYKVELIEDLPEDAEISLYSQGEFVDLCAGAHLMSTGAVRAFKLTSATGAYWRGNSDNKMLCRIYGTAYPKAAALEERLLQIEEAKKRDHNKLGRELELFTTCDFIGQGLPILLPKGAQGTP